MLTVADLGNPCALPYAPEPFSARYPARRSGFSEVSCNACSQRAVLVFNPRRACVTEILKHFYRGFSIVERMSLQLTLHEIACFAPDRALGGMKSHRVKLTSSGMSGAMKKALPFWTTSPTKQSTEVLINFSNSPADCSFAFVLGRYRLNGPGDRPAIRAAFRLAQERSPVVIKNDKAKTMTRGLNCALCVLFRLRFDL